MYNDKRLQRAQDAKAAIIAKMTAILDRADKESEGKLGEDDLNEYSEFEAALKETEASLQRATQLAEYERSLQPIRDINEPTEAEKEAQTGEPTKPPAFESFGHQAMAIANAAAPGAVRDPRLTWDGGGGVGAATGLSEAVAADGGFLVQTDTSNELLKRLHDTGTVWSRCRNIPISANANGVKINAINETSRADGSRWGGIRAYWKAEAAAKTASDPEFRQIELNLKKLIGLCYATDELLQDAGALEAILMDGFVEEFGFKLDDAVINGLGAGQPLGILNAGCLVSVAKETGQAAGTVVAENIDKMWSRLWAKSQASAVWFINQSVQPELDNMFRAVGAGGIPAYMPAGGLSVSPYGTLKGRPVIPIEQCAAPGTVGDIILADMSQYVTCTKGGIQTASSIHLKFNYDETTFRWVYRADGQPTWAAALTPYKDATKTQSPFVALAAR